MPEETTRIALIDSDFDFLEFLVRQLPADEHLDVVGVFANGESALRAIPGLRPELVIMDPLPHDKIAWSRIAALKRLSPSTQILVLTGSADTRHIIGALRAGANGYLLKPTRTNEVREAIRSIRTGGSPMSAAISRKLVELLRAPDKRSHEVWDILSERENSVMRLLAQGLIAKEIADRLGISFTTARFHIRRIYRKLEVRSRTEALLKYQGHYRASS